MPRGDYPVLAPRTLKSISPPWSPAQHLAVLSSPSFPPPFMIFSSLCSLSPCHCTINIQNFKVAESFEKKKNYKNRSFSFRKHDFRIIQPSLQRINAPKELIPCSFLSLTPGGQHHKERCNALRRRQHLNRGKCKLGYLFSHLFLPVLSFVSSSCYCLLTKYTGTLQINMYVFHLLLCVCVCVSVFIPFRQWNAHTRRHTLPWLNL